MAIVRELDLVVLGDVNPDVVVRDADPVFGQHEGLVSSIELTIGGSAAIMAAAAARLGLRVALVGVVGDDAFGRFMLAELDARGVDVGPCRIDPGVPTGASVILTRRTDRAILTAMGTITGLTGADVAPDLVVRTRHLHVGSYFLLTGLHAGLPDVVRVAHESGTTVSIDPNWDPAERWDSGLSRLLPHIDVFLPNEAEARLISGRQSTEEAAHALAGRGDRPVVVVKRGDNGALAVRGGARAIEVPAYPVEPVDTVGAGDAFDAAFLAAWIDGRPLSDCVAVAVVAGSLSTRSMGGTAGQATRSEIDAALTAWRHA